MTRKGRLLAGALAAVVVLGSGLAVLRRQASEPAPPLPVVHAERAGLKLGTQALTGRVALVSSTPVRRWRIVGVTAWRRAAGGLLTRSWDTTEWSDGVYRLELETADGLASQAVVVRNRTPLEPSLEANASAGLEIEPTDDRAVVATFGRRSYRPGDTAVLELWDRYPAARIAVLHVGPERQLTVGNEIMEGVPVGRPLVVAPGTRRVRIPIGRWESGLYTARLTSGSKVGFAPFVLRPVRLGAHRVAVVQPTNTWQAYNYRCADGDGRPDTWYFTTRCRTVDLSRPYLQRGVPPHFRQYDVSFLRWLDRTGRHVDMLAQEDLERLTGEALRRLYRLVVFPGHHEYVTEKEYDVVQRYRDLGGNLAFLSANNFFWRVDREGDRITRIGLWRDLGRPEAALVGVQYFDWNRGTYDTRPYVVVGASAEPDLFAGTGLRNGDTFGMFGIEVDARTPASPRSIRVVAVMPNVFGTVRAAEMTYYETPAGARVFATGAFTLAGTQARCPWMARFLENVWRKLEGGETHPAFRDAWLGRCTLESAR